MVHGVGKRMLPDIKTNRSFLLLGEQPDDRPGIC